MRAGILVGVAACSTAYQPGSITTSRSFDARLTLGCLDVGLSRVRSEHDGAPIVGYAFGNGCDHRVMVDLASVHVTGKAIDGRETPLVAYDPRHELRVLTLPARLAAVEYIEYSGAAQAYAKVCVDAGGIAADLPRSEQIICL
jgi:hypothetical protein